MKKAIVGIVLMVGLLAGCGPAASLSPLYTAKDVIFDPSLLGKWSDGTPESNLAFEKDGQDAYRAIVNDVYTDDNGSHSNQSVYIAHMVSLGGRRFLDVVPDQWPAQEKHISINANNGQALTNGSVLALDSGYYAQINNPNSPESSVSLKQGHWVFRVDLNGDTLKIATLQEDWLAKAIQQGQVGVSITKTSDGEAEPVITADTADFQRFIADHASDNQAFEASPDMHRVR